VDIVGERAPAVGSVLCMRMILLVAVATVVLLAGCGGPPPVVEPTETVGEPVFASEEEALAAAEEVFGKYVDATDTMSLSGGEDLSGFDGLLTPNQLADETEQAEGLKAEGKRLIGSHGYFDFRLQQVDQSNPPEVYLQAYVCADLTNVKYVDAQGNDTSDPDRALSAPLEAVFVNTIENPSTLLIEDVRQWTGEDFCS